MPSNLSAFLKNLPGLGRLWAIGSNELRSHFTNSSEYWDRRYRTGGNSGAGSYNRLAGFKATFLNQFVEENQITTVVEYGCGDGAQLRLAKYPVYLGVDVSPTALEMCKATFSNDSSKTFLSPTDVRPEFNAELALSLDVIYHLVENSIFESYMRRLFQSATRFVIIYSSNVDHNWPSPHVRHRKFTEWIELNAPDWRLQKSVANPYPYNPEEPDSTSFADFFIFERA